MNNDWQRIIVNDKGQYYRSIVSLADFAYFGYGYRADLTGQLSPISPETISLNHPNLDKPEPRRQDWEMGRRELKSD